MVRQMTEGFLDGFCVGEPWAALAAHQQHGATVAATTQLVPNHPEKVLAVSRRWLAANRSAAERLIRAVLRGCAYCADAAHAPELARMLSLPGYLDVSEEIVASTLAAGAEYRSWLPPSTFPSATHAAWLLDLMRKWGHVPAGADLIAIAQESVDTHAYRAAAASLGMDCPETDFAPMRLRKGQFDPVGAHGGACGEPRRTVPVLS
jgi:ABC-type nitrate/sulfonate/bicarbonate transport system substrate-binding protein